MITRLRLPQVCLREQPGEAESDLWDRLQMGSPAEEMEVVRHLRANTRSAGPPPTSENSQKIKLPVKLLRQGEKDPSNSKSRASTMDSEFEEDITVSNVQSK